MCESKPTKFECGCIYEGDYCNLYVLPFAIACRDSAWDFPSFVMALQLEHLWAEHTEPFVALVPGHFCDRDVTMYPTHADVLKIANAIDLLPDERDKFLADFPLNWDT